MSEIPTPLKEKIAEIIQNSAIQDSSRRDTTKQAPLLTDEERAIVESGLAEIRQRKKSQVNGCLNGSHRGEAH